MSTIEIELQYANCAPPLTGRQSSWIEKLLERPGLLDDLVTEWGSPLHLFATAPFDENVEALGAPLRERGLDGGLYFARKANKLPWFVSRCLDLGIGVDTASLEELEETLALGLPEEQVVLTAVGKSARLVARAVEAGVLIVADNHDELNAIKQAARQIGRSARIGLRFSGFELDGRTIHSRFGFPLKEAGDVLERVIHCEHLRVSVLHAHLDRYDPRERAAAVRQLMEIADGLAAGGQNVDGIDIGGGILMRYLDDAAQWEAFLSRLQEAVQGRCEPITVGNDGFGFRLENGALVGQPDLYPAYNEIAGAKFIEAVLDNDESGKHLYRELKERGMKLFFEPGRALLDGAGATVASVVFRKRDTRGDLLVGLAMNRMNLRPFRAEFCVDPILLAGGLREASREGAFLVGCLCSESDFIYRRRLAMEQIPEPGDLFVFPNTAGYLVHHMEIGTHGGSLPANLLIEPENFSVLENR
ncbi:MAG: alanine racemase [Cyanobacteria bacterium HKST-UBA02]|nr:alanine racemase [Cyanobacteria bacterium HKST-UBA02]